MKNNQQQDQFRAFERNGQLVLALNSEILLSENAPVRRANALLEELDYRKLYEAYSPKGRKSVVDPKVMFKVTAYAYECGIYSTRQMEEACRYRVDFMWLLEDQPVPDHSTLSKFRTGRCAEAIESFIKPANYEQVKTKKYKSQPGRPENMTYNAEADSYTCAKGRTLVKLYESVDKHSRSGAVISCYRCENCVGCSHRALCCNAKNPDTPKEIRIRKQFLEKRAEFLENITTEEGVFLRMCRSIQVEGSFALLKNDFAFRRFLTTGKKNVKIELLFLALGFNLKKNWMKAQASRSQTHLSSIKKTA